MQTKIATSPKKPFDALAVDHEPTDEELALLMQDVGRVAREKRAASDAWLQAQIEKEVRSNAKRFAYLHQQSKRRP